MIPIRRLCGHSRHESGCAACRDVATARKRRDRARDRGAVNSPARSEFLAHLNADAREWMDQAVCTQVDPELFFPERGESTAEAKAVCRDCPVRDVCLEYALDHGEKWGVWGGRSARERQGIQRRRAKEARLEREAVA